MNNRQYKWIVKRDVSTSPALAPYLGGTAWYTKNINDAMLFDSQHAAIAFLAAQDDAWDDGTYHGDVLSLVKVSVEVKQVVVEVK